MRLEEIVKEKKASQVGVDPLVAMKHRDFMGQVGAGSFGAVWKAACRGQQVAVKRPDLLDIHV